MLDSIPIAGPKPHFHTWEQVALEKTLKPASVLLGEEPFHHPVPLSLPPSQPALTACISSPGIYVIGFSYPVVPKGKARIRVQISAVHSDEDIDQCVEAFTEVGRKHGALS